MADWTEKLNYDPIQPLLESEDKAVIHFTRRCLLGDPPTEPEESLLALPEINKIIKKQGGNGAWQTRQKENDPGSAVNHDLIETWRQFRVLVEQYGLERSQPCVEKAAEYLFSNQTEDGDIRGFLANQYAMYYTGAVLALLTKAGYGDDPRIEKGFRWLLAARQDDGGWVANPLMTLEEVSWADTIALTSQAREIVKIWDRTKPFCINGTGMVIRAFAVHPGYRKSEAARTAARLLKRHFFEKNNYTSYQHKDNWLVFRYPYWWNNLVSALDAVSLIIPEKNDEDIQRAVHWLIEHQENNGLWKTTYSSIHKNTTNAKTKEAQLWITLAICRILKRIIMLEE